MVLGVCRQLLGDRHHAEDAFQATFLVLARKADRIREPDLLGNWLYGVAFRTARCNKHRLALRRKGEESDALKHSGPGSADPADRPVLAREQAEALHVEIDRLPDAFRLPLVLCYFEGLTVHEAARRLRCSHGTVRSRLARARDKLRRGLTRRGVALPAAALAAVLDSRPASASVSSPLCDITTRAAIGFAAGQAASPSAAALAREVLRSMFIRKLKLTALALLFLGSIATGVGIVGHALAMKDEPQKTATAPQSSNPRSQVQNPKSGRMFVVGRVLDPQGKPVPDATIMVHARSLPLASVPYTLHLGQVPIGDARADSSGRFRLDAPRTSSSHYEAFGAVALAPGYGAGWVELDPDDEQPTADITLRPEQVIHGRLFDLQGKPVPNVTLSVSSIHRVPPKSPAGVRSRFDGVAYSWPKVIDFPAWPRPMTTDPEGRFTLRGLGRGLAALLTVHDPRFALQRIEVEADQTSESKSITAALVPAQILNLRVTYADTGKPAPHAPLLVTASRGRVAIPVDFESDAEGRLRANPPPADRSYNVTAYPPEGQPYLMTTKRLEWPKGALEQSLDIALPRGVSIRGRVTEEGSGKPVPGATVDFASRAGRLGSRENRGVASKTASDGSFQLGAMPSPGYLSIKGPSDDYVLQSFGYRMVTEGQPGGRRIYSHAHAWLDLKPGIGSQEVNVVLRRGATVTGRVLGPDDQPIQDAWIFSRIILDPRDGPWENWTVGRHGNVRNGRFEIHGLAPDADVPVYFLDPRRKLGGVVNLSGKSASGGPVSVRLEPCGAARARLVGPGGKPVAGRLPRGYLIFSMVVTPGPPSSTAKDQAGLPFADEGSLTAVDPVNYANELVCDADGRITLPVLIPGATYRFLDDTTPRGTVPHVKEFSVKPGETLDLGDLRIEKQPTS